ncbi:MAG: alpha/beta hydrolase [Actinomycetota bacterium]|nr:alpha/beta hydrolase [Actinomycetota bacterium]
MTTLRSDGARLSEAELAPRETTTGMWPGRYVEVAGARVFVRTTPALSALPTGSEVVEHALLIHGLGGASINWTDFAGLLRGRFRGEAIDLLGHGRSGPSPDGDYRVAAHAAMVIGYLEQSGNGPVHLVGNSMGGAVSIVVAAKRPDLVRTLTLISPAVPDNNKLRAHALRGDPRMALLVLPGLGGAAMRRVAGETADKRVRATIALVFGDPSRYPAARLDEAISEAQARESDPWINVAFLRSLRGLVRMQFVKARETWSAMRSIQAPTLIVWGGLDRLVAPALANDVAAAIPDSRLLVLDDVGHTAMMEDPETTARAMLGLVEDVAARR